ncbi:unnamed protein product, partial [Phaeothamnion confervicola]
GGGSVGGWLEVVDLEPPSAAGLDSPVVQAALDAWVDTNKRRVLESWLQHVVGGGAVAPGTLLRAPGPAAGSAFVPALQISGLTREARSGLLLIVLPLLLRRRGVRLSVFVRERREVVSDLRVRVREQ